MALIHFTKRTIECTGLHFYSKSTKSLNKLIWEMVYTWLFFGAGIGYYLFHPNYKDPFWMRIPGNSIMLFWVLLVAFIFFEGMNLLCHLHLKSFRKKVGDTKLGIPTLHGFRYVACANYFWEIMAWSIFTLVS